MRLAVRLDLDKAGPRDAAAAHDAGGLDAIEDRAGERRRGLQRKACTKQQGRSKSHRGSYVFRSVPHRPCERSEAIHLAVIEALPTGPHQRRRGLPRRIAPRNDDSVETQNALRADKERPARWRRADFPTGAAGSGDAARSVVSRKRRRQRVEARRGRRRRARVGRRDADRRAAGAAVVRVAEQIAVRDGRVACR